MISSIQVWTLYIFWLIGFVMAELPWIYYWRKGQIIFKDEKKVS